MNPIAPPTRWSIELETKPDFDQAMGRIYAWYEQEVIDRPPVRFSRHNALYADADAAAQARYGERKEWWFDAEYQMERFLRGLAGKRFLGETFPLFWPNLGPNVFAGCYGTPLIFGEVTTWAEPMLTDYAQPPLLNMQSEYVAKLDELTNLALEQAPGRFLVGYTDLHPGIDWLAALRGTEPLLYDLYDNPDDVEALLAANTADFLTFYDHYDALLKAHNQPSVSWMEIPSFGRMHIPSCDFATMVSPRHFRQYIWPSLAAECVAMTHNVFHMDGKGVAHHLDAILELPNVQAIQWVQGVADDLPIMQWVELIAKIQKAGKSVVVDLQLDELDPFMDAIRPEGILICVSTESEEQEHDVLRKLGKWVN